MSEGLVQPGTWEGQEGDVLILRAQALASSHCHGTLPLASMCASHNLFRECCWSAFGSWSLGKSVLPLGKPWGAGCCHSECPVVPFLPQ